jgi:hypothetical protein
LRGRLNQGARVTQKKTAPEDKIIAVAKGAESIPKKHRAVAVGGPWLWQMISAPRRQKGKQSDENERRKRAFDRWTGQLRHRYYCLNVLVVPTGFEPVLPT